MNKNELITRYGKDTYEKMLEQARDKEGYDIDEVMKKMMKNANGRTVELAKEHKEEEK